MNFNSKLMDRMRAVTRNLSGKGPQAATAAIQDALKILQPRQPAAPAQPVMRDINPPPAGARPAGPQAEPATTPTASTPSSPMQEMSEKLKALVPEMMANLDRNSGAGLQGLKGFKMPDFELPGGMQGVRSPAPALPGTFVDSSYTNAAGTRSYKLYIPSSYNNGKGGNPNGGNGKGGNPNGGASVPLVVMLHGCTQDPDDFANGTQMNLLAEELGCLVVYPAQSQQANVSRCWNWFNANDQARGQGEPSIIAGITETVMHEYAIDPGQVYVAGLSAGGAMATIMGTLYPELYAAVGVHSGLPFASASDLPSALAAMKGNFGPGAPRGKPVPIIVFHGDRDTTVHPACGEEIIKQGTHAGARQIVVEPGSVPDGHSYTRTVHQRDDGSPQAEQWLIHGAGHAWSGGSAHGSYTDGKGPDASREMMRFFQTKRA
jgi:poly(hydroxyalkanoate) depolymerase family esterase